MARARNVEDDDNGNASSNGSCVTYQHRKNAKSVGYAGRTLHETDEMAEMAMRCSLRYENIGRPNPAATGPTLTYRRHSGNWCGAKFSVNLTVGETGSIEILS
jgi:hypothetical protein